MAGIIAIEQTVVIILLTQLKFASKKSTTRAPNAIYHIFGINWREWQNMIPGRFGKDDIF